MFKIASLVAILTIVSKILGLIRDLVIAHYFGTSMLADAFNMAYLFTGNFFIIFGTIGGPFYSSIVATLPKLPENKITWEFIKDILFKTALVFTGIALMIYLFKTLFLKLFIDPATQADYFNATLWNIDILLPLIILCGPIGILFGVLNCFEKYYSPSLSPAIVNIPLIIAVLLMGDTYNGIALALGTTLGAILSLLFQLPDLNAVKKRLLGKDIADFLIPEDSLQESAQKVMHQKQKILIGEFSHILFPALLSTGLSQAIVFIDGYFCKGLEPGSWTAITLGNRLVQLPLGILLTAFLVPISPRISELVRENKIQGIKNLLKRSLGTLLLVSLPAMIIGQIWSRDIIRIIFERGAFDERSTLMVAGVTFYLCFSIIPYLLRDSFTRVCFSFGDSRTPLYIMILTLLIKTFLNALLVGKYGINGIAISTSVVSAINAGILFFVLQFKFKKAEQLSKPS